MQNIQLTLTLDEINLILEALAELPFVRVHRLIAIIQQNASRQLQELEPSGSSQPMPTADTVA